MYLWKRPDFLGLLIVTGCACLLSLVFAPTHSMQNGGGLAISQSSLDFGEVQERDRFEWHIDLTNLANSDMSVSDIKSSCSCTSIEPLNLKISPTQRAELELLIDLRSKRQPGDFAKRNVALAFTARCECKGVSFKSSWLLRGVAVPPPIQVDPAAIDFERTPVAGDRFPEGRVHVYCQPHVTDLKAFCDPNIAKVSVSRSPNDPWQFVLSTTVNDRATIGHLSYPITLEPILSGVGTQTHLKTVIPVHAVVYGNVRLQPEDLVLGAINVGENATETIALLSDNNVPFDVEEVVVDDEAVVVNRMPGADSNAVYYSIVVSVRTQGTQQKCATFVIVERDTGRRYSVSGKLIFYGKAKI